MHFNGFRKNYAFSAAFKLLIKNHFRRNLIDNVQVHHKRSRSVIQSYALFAYTKRAYLYAHSEGSGRGNWRTDVFQGRFENFVTLCTLIARLNIICSFHSLISLPSIAQLVERRTVVGSELQISLGRWFDSGSKEFFLHFDKRNETERA